MGLNSLPSGFGSVLKKYRKAGLSAGDAMRKTWAEFKGRYAHQGNSKRGRPSRSRFCSERLDSPDRFDPRSFRTVTVKDHRVTVGCPKGHYDAKNGRCKVGTRAQRILHPQGEEKCPVAGKEIRKHSSKSNPVHIGVLERVNPNRNPLTIREAAEVMRRAKAAAKLARRAKQKDPTLGTDRFPTAELQEAYMTGAKEALIGVRLMFGPGKHTKENRKNPDRHSSSRLCSERKDFYKGESDSLAMNPTKKPVPIYDRLLEIRAQKGRDSHYAGQRFKHAFRSGAKVYGMSDGSVMIKGPHRLWRNFPA